MSLFWFATLSLHVLAAISWIGGMVFLSLVLAPLIRKGSATPEYMGFFRSAARRFRIVVWLSIAVLLSTGPLLLHQRGLSMFDAARWPAVLVLKVGLIGFLLLLTFSHDLLLGPLVSRISAMPADARTVRDQILMRSSRWLPRLSLLIALAVVIAAVVLARS